MTVPEKPSLNRTPELAQEEPGLSENDVRHMGRTGIVTSEHASAQPIDVEIEGIEPAHFAPAGARPYEGTAKRGLEVADNSDQAKIAAEYLGSMFPGAEFSFLGAGRYGVVMADQTGKAYKLYRSALSYSRSEKEAGALKLLSDEGLAPKLHLFVDAGKQYRLDRKAYDYTKFGFEDVQIPRQDSGRELPVMVMDRVDAGPLEDAAPEQLIEGFCKTAAVFLRENIYAWDMEVMLDEATGRVTILDAGELSQEIPDPTTLTPETQQRNESEIIRCLCLDFGLSNVEYKILGAFKEGGLEAVRSYLAQTL